MRLQARYDRIDDLFEFIRVQRLADPKAYLDLKAQHDESKSILFEAYLQYFGIK